MISYFSPKISVILFPLILVLNIGCITLKLCAWNFNTTSESDGIAQNGTHEDKKEVEQVLLGGNSSKNSTKRTYFVLLQVKRKEHSAAIKAIFKIEDIRKRAKLLKQLADRMKQSILESKEHLEKVGFDLEFDNFPSEEGDLRESVAKVIENAAFFSEIALYYPDFAHKYTSKDPSFLRLYHWACSIGENYGIYDETTQKMMKLAAQELYLVAREENYVNPYSHQSRKEEIQRKAYEEFERKRAENSKASKQQMKKGKLPRNEL